MCTWLKVFGERNSGTTFVQSLLAQNLPVKILPGATPWILYRGFPFELVRDTWFWWTEKRNLGWKHRFPDEMNIREFSKKKQLLVVSVFKNPYAFLLSLFKRPYHLGLRSKTFTAFLREPCPVVRREHAKGAFNNPIELWNAKNRVLLDLSQLNLPVILLRYENVLADPEAAVERIGRVCHLKQTGLFRGVPCSTKRDRERSFEDFQSHYLNEKWQADLTREQVEIINDFLDIHLCRELGYAVLDAESFAKRAIV